MLEHITEDTTVKFIIYTKANRLLAVKTKEPSLPIFYGSEKASFSLWFLLLRTALFPLDEAETRTAWELQHEHVFSFDDCGCLQIPSIYTGHLPWVLCFFEYFIVM